jgi:hypothetical protein
MEDYEYVIEGLYSDYGYEDVSTYPGTSKGKREALADLDAYRENEPQYHHRLRSRKAS